MGLVEGFAEPKHRIAVDDYRRMAETGVLAPEARVELIVEVSDSIRRYDRRVKVPLYARHGVPEVWVIDLENRLAYFHRRPSGDTYADITANESPGVTPVATLAGVAVDLSGLL